MAGDRDAEAELYQAYLAPLTLLLHRRFWGQEFIDDVLQETFAVALETLRAGKLKQPRAIQAFLRTTAINIAYEYLRNERQHGSSADSISVEQIPDLQGDLYEQIEAEDLLRFAVLAIDDLSVDRDRDILMCFYFDGESKDNICNSMKLSPVQFDRVLHRARLRLRDLIASKQDTAQKRLKHYATKSLIGFVMSLILIFVWPQ